jgi:hypothetical protein
MKRQREENVKRAIEKEKQEAADALAKLEDEKRRFGVLSRCANGVRLQWT